MIRRILLTPSVQSSLILVTLAIASIVLVWTLDPLTASPTWGLLNTFLVAILIWAVIDLIENVHLTILNTPCWILPAYPPAISNATDPRPYDHAKDGI